MPVEIVHWNPSEPVIPGRVGRRLPFNRPINNFGDLIGPMLVDRMLDDVHVDGDKRARAQGRLLTVGSILHFARPGDVIWGSGINGKAAGRVDGRVLDIRAVRGPLTKRSLEANGGRVPAVFGDPGLLWPRFWPKETYVDAAPSAEVTIVPNFHDFAEFKNDARAVNPQSPVHEVVRRIANSAFVCGSSLHGIIIAESFGIPARLIRSKTEPPFKYDDYYAGSGRDKYSMAAHASEAIDLGGEDPISWDPQPLLDAFPIDLWSALPTDRKNL